MFQVHATCVEVDGCGVLLRGPAGRGKSDLALRLIDRGAHLVADDRTDLRAAKGNLLASAPREIAGLLEVRGLGIVRVGCTAEARVGLVVDLEAAERIERLPEPDTCDYLGIVLPRLALAPFEGSAAAKLRLMVQVVCGRMFCQEGAWKS